ncbi:MAG: SDR family NAD(P)-dependent oxidoreductase [Dehalococcoidia bacterium]
MKELSGGTAILTGASRGIGPYIARALAREGLNLVLAARSPTGLDTVAEEVRGIGVRAIPVPTDVADAQAREALLTAATDEFGAVDVLVNNAGIEKTIDYHRTDPVEIQQVIDVNLVAVMLLTRLVLPGMLQRGRGHVVNMSSLAGKVGAPYEAPYSATKFALVGFTQSLRAEYHGSGVSASVICPGFVADAGMYADMNAETGVKAPRMVGTSSPEKVAKAVVTAIKRDKPEIIVNPHGVRALLTLGEAFPSLGERLARRTGAHEMFRRTAKARFPDA